jgi:hypothetical protein
MYIFIYACTCIPSVERETILCSISKGMSMPCRCWLCKSQCPIQPGFHVPTAWAICRGTSALIQQIFVRFPSHSGWVQTGFAVLSTHICVHQFPAYTSIHIPTHSKYIPSTSQYSILPWTSCVHLYYEISTCEECLPVVSEKIQLWMDESIGPVVFCSGVQYKLSYNQARPNNSPFEHKKYVEPY